MNTPPLPHHWWVWLSPANLQSKARSVGWFAKMKATDFITRCTLPFTIYIFSVSPFSVSAKITQVETAGGNRGITNLLMHTYTIHINSSTSHSVTVFLWTVFFGYYAYSKTALHWLEQFFHLQLHLNAALQYKLKIIRTKIMLLLLLLIRTHFCITFRWNLSPHTLPTLSFKNLDPVHLMIKNPDHKHKNAGGTKTQQLIMDNIGKKITCLTAFSQLHCKYRGSACRPAHANSCLFCK